MNPENIKQSNLAAEVAANLGRILARPVTPVQRAASERQSSVADKRRNASAHLNMRIGSAVQGNEVVVVNEVE